MNDLDWTFECFAVDSAGHEKEYLNVIYPNNDRIDHDLLCLTCVCVPAYKIILFPHGPGCDCLVNQVVHHSLDGRELYE